MEKTTITLHTQFQIGPVDPRLFGGFLEHIGRTVYGGVYDPESRLADGDGLRSDVADALRQLRFTIIRYPGGNFASGYHWQDGVGPREQRPKVRELAWNTVEPNTFGTDEFIHLCHKMDWEPMLTVNMGTGTPEEASNWVEYCNGPAGTRYADMRVANGHSEPYGVKLWCLGNEMDGPWQLGHVPAGEYALRAQQAAKLMRDVDKSIEFVVCGTCVPELSTYMEWDRQVLDYLGDFADYVAIHRYVGNDTDDTADYLASTNLIDRQIEDTDACCRFVQAKHRSAKYTYQSFDEWSAVHRGEEGSTTIYNLEDALVTAGFLNSFIRHADVVKIANQTMITNDVAPVVARGDDLLIQTIFYPMRMFATRGQGIALSPALSGPRYTGKANGEVHTIDTSAIWDNAQLHVFATNRSLTESAPVHIVVADRKITGLINAEVVTGSDAKAQNTFESPHMIQSRPLQQVSFAEGQADLQLPSLSVAALTFALG